MYDVVTHISDVPRISDLTLAMPLLYLLPTCLRVLHYKNNNCSRHNLVKVDVTPLICLCGRRGEMQVAPTALPPGPALRKQVVSTTLRPLYLGKIQVRIA